MVFVNDAITWEIKPVSVMRDFLVLLQPFAPHLTEELWAKLNASLGATASSLSYVAWPKWNPEFLIENTLDIPIQVNGKLRDVLKVATNIPQADLEAAALASEKVKPYLEGKTIKKVIVVPEEALVNVVAV